MSLDSLIARAEYVLNGRVEGGECANCGRNGIVIDEHEGVFCEYCDFESDMPDVPGWL